MKKTILILFLIINLQGNAQQNILEKLLTENPEYFKHLTESPEKYRLQIVYTQINRDPKNIPFFTTYKYRANLEEYFYPASTVKLAGSVLALEKINLLKKYGINKFSPMITLKNSLHQTAVNIDTTSESGLPSLEHYIKKILLVSDNDAYNRLYEFLGQKQFNEEMKSKGFNGVRFTHRLQIALAKEENQRTNSIKFLKNEDTSKVLWSQEEQVNTSNIESEFPILLGKGVMNDSGIVENRPINFSQKNAFPILEQHEFLKRLIFPEAFTKEKQFNLTDDDYNFIYRYMSQYPTESKIPNYLNDTTIYSTYCKFLFYGSDKTKKPNSQIRIFNKVGDAYGFLLDNVYFVDFKNKVEFLISAVLLCNEDEIFNDDKYDYETIGFPFYKNLGKVIYEHELKREKKYLPELSKFKFDYNE